MKSVKELRKTGHSVKITHMRKVKRFDLQSYKIRTEEMKSYAAKVKNAAEEVRLMPNGGTTTVAITTPNGKVYSASAKCGDRDAYIYKRGVNMCLGRINKKMHINGENID